MDDVVDVLQAKRDTDQIWCDTALDLLLVRDLLVCGAPWVDNERFRIADVREM